jgi:hypothetical protein
MEHWQQCVLECLGLKFQGISRLSRGYAFVFFSHFGQDYTSNTKLEKNNSFNKELKFGQAVASIDIFIFLAICYNMH